MYGAQRGSYTSLGSRAVSAVALLVAMSIGVLALPAAAGPVEEEVGRLLLPQTAQLHFDNGGGNTDWHGGEDCWAQLDNIHHSTTNPGNIDVKGRTFCTNATAAYLRTYVRLYWNHPILGSTLMDTDTKACSNCSSTGNAIAAYACQSGTNYYYAYGTHRAELYSGEWDQAETATQEWLSC